VGRRGVSEVLPSSLVISVQTAALWPAGVHTRYRVIIRWPRIPSRPLRILVSNPNKHFSF
jgi:hypothetical protein